MINKISKIILGVLAVFLVIILIIPEHITLSGTLVNTGYTFVGFTFLMIIGIVAFIVSVSLAYDIKKLNNSSFSKILSVVFVDTILYCTSLLFYDLGNIGVGDKGLLLIFTSLVYSILLATSIIVGIILVVRNKENPYQGSPNKILAPTLILVLIIFFYTPMVSGIARISQSPDFCSLHIEMKGNSFIFGKDSQDSCILRIALDASSVTYCKQIKDSYSGVNERKNMCILNVARNLRDKDLCYQIPTSSEWLSRCIEYITDRKSPGYYYEDREEGKSSPRGLLYND